MSGDEESSEGETVDGVDANLYHECVIEEMFVDEKVATAVAEMVAEQEAWGNTVTAVQVFNSLLDAVSAAILAQEDGIATINDIISFCGCCRWLEDLDGVFKIDSVASHAVDAFRATVQGCLASHEDRFQKQQHGFVQGSSTFVPQMTSVDLPRSLQLTSLWFELTQSALTNRANRVAKMSGFGAKGRGKQSQEKASPKHQQDQKRRRPKEEVNLTDGLRPRLIEAMKYLMGREGADVFNVAIDKNDLPVYFEVIEQP